MSKFRKRPVEVEAFQWFPDMGEGGGVVRDYDHEGMKPKGDPKEPLYRVKTLEGWYAVTVGDWIVTGIKGERYPVRSDIFEVTYEAVEVSQD